METITQLNFLITIASFIQAAFAWSLVISFYENSVCQQSCIIISAMATIKGVFTCICANTGANNNERRFGWVMTGIMGTIIIPSFLIYLFLLSCIDFSHVIPLLIASILDILYSCFVCYVACHQTVEILA
jgi:hypothetical protein